MNLTRARVLALRWVRGLRRPRKDDNERRLRERGESIDALTIRDATAADIPELARLHVITWNAAYFPTKGPSAEIRERQWREKFATNDGRWFLILLQRPDGVLIGFAVGINEDEPGRGELNKIYLLEEYHGLGLGRRLIGEVARRFLRQGITSMYLFAEADNPTCGFYEAMGGVNMLNDDGSTNYGNYQWTDIRALAALRPPE